MLCSATPSAVPPHADANIPSYAHIVLHFLRSLSPSAASGSPRGLLSPSTFQNRMDVWASSHRVSFMSTDVILIVDDSQ
jgi:hypothetical protein